MVNVMNNHEYEKSIHNNSRINIIVAVKEEDMFSHFIYFDTNKYPVGDNPFKNDTWKILKNHI